MSQTTLDDLSASGDDRPEAEAVAVAGETATHVSEVIDAGDVRVPEPTAETAVELMVTAVDYTVEGRGSDEYPVVHVFGRTADDEREHVRVVGVEPYFYVPTADITDRDLVSEYDVILDTREHPHGDPDNDRFESIRGEPVTKITTRTPRDVGQIRDEFATTYEADILFPNRFLIDHGVTAGLRVEPRRIDGDPDEAIQVTPEHLEATDVDANLRVNTFDIEVDDRNGFPENGEEPIVCLTSHDSYRDEYVLWLYDAPDGEGVVDESFDDYEFISEGSTVRVEQFDDEDAMLDAFLAYLDETDADLTTGWNFEDFDAPYLFDRMEELNGASDYDLSPDRASRVDETWRSGWGGPDVKGRVVFDLLYAYQRTKFSELDSYRLDAVAELELGVGKERYTGDIGDLWEDDPTRLLEYNLRDVELCVEIDRQQNLIDFWDDTRKFVGCQLEDAPTPGDVVDMYVLHQAFGEFVLPTKGQQAGEEFEGGAVFEPISGVAENVSVLDLKCFSRDTELVTPDGVRGITDIEEGDEVYTLNPDTFECEVKPVTETHQYQNEYGELHHLSGNTHDLKVTENHQFMISDARGWDDQRPSDFEMAAYRDIPGYERFAFPQHEPVSGRFPEMFDLAEAVTEGHVSVYADSLTSFRNAVPEGVMEVLDHAQGTSAKLASQQRVSKYLVPVEKYREYREVIEREATEVYLKYDRGHSELPTTVSMEQWLKLIGWYVTEGSVDHTNGRITIHQSDEENREDICRLLDGLSIQYNTDERGVNISNQILVNWFSRHCGVGAEEKRLPDWTFDLDGNLLETLLETMIRGDGSRTESGLGEFWTKSDDLKDGFLDIAVRCGEKPSVAEEEGGMWYASAGKRGSFKKNTNASVEEHDGDVFCVTAADNHVVLAGRNGNFQWVGQSLYPMCMVTINASPETIVDDPESYDGETYRAPDGTRFRKEPDGMMREMVDALLTEREQKKQRRDEHEPGTEAYNKFDRQQSSIKVIMNSLYGVSGWEQFRLYDKDNAAAITAMGRRVIEFTEEEATKIGYNITYGDTDSIMISLSDVSTAGVSVPDELREAHPEMSQSELETLAAALAASEKIEEHINESYDEFASEELGADEHRFQIEFEKLYRRFFQAGKKKRYAGHIVWKEGKHVDSIDITGFEYTRSDIAPITKRVQQRVIEMIVTGEPLDDVKEFLHGEIQSFKAGDVDVDEIGIPGGIGKKLDNYDTDTAQVRGAKYANLLLGTNFQSGSKPKRLYLEKVHPDFFERVESETDLTPNGPREADALYTEFKRDPDVICYEFPDELPSEFEVDHDVMLEKTLQKPISPIVESLGLSWDEIESGQEQTGLGQWG